MLNGLIIDQYRTKRWYKDDILHNENGPAIEYTNGDKLWYINGKRHRLDGPAAEWSNEDKCWSKNDKYWYYEGQRISCSSQEEFEQLIKLKVLW